MPETETIHVDAIDEENAHGKWFVVYRQGEGFQPWVLAVRTDSETSAEEAWLNHDRNRAEFAHADASDVEDIAVRRVNIVAVPTT